MSLNLRRNFIRQITRHQPIRPLFQSIRFYSVSENLVDKYRDKLQEKAKEKGVSVNDLLTEAKKTNTAQPLPILDSINSAAETPKPVKKTIKQAPPSHIKPLSSILKLDHILEESAERISTIWNSYHQSKHNCISAVIQEEFWVKLKERAKEYPLFILPLPRSTSESQGYEFFFLQFTPSLHEIYITPLIEYQTHRENAKPAFVITHYPDLLDLQNLQLREGFIGDFSLDSSKNSKGIVLMHGEPVVYGDEAPKVSVADAQTLIYQLQLYYVTGGDEMFKLVEDFYKNPKNFQYHWLIEMLEKMVSK
ncbi:hypothetical protein HK098_000498 [Nowakowskiella sp. JEL0407]|nr:hypothetical protein HK098_000498 [Nowakowskiella sp. JEL0407]